MSEMLTQKLGAIYDEMGEFIYMYLQQYQIDKSRMISTEIVNGVRAMTMDYMKECLDIIIDAAIENGEENIERKSK